MANIIITVDRDPARRALFLGRLRGRIAPLPGLKESEGASGDFHALWAAVPKAPISFFSDGSSAAFVAGDAIPGPEPERLNASRLMEFWRETPGQIPAPFDGFHVAAFYRPGTGLVLGADPIGCFPVYYHAGRDFLLIGTSPELFRSHPDFKSRLDPKGLAGILLTNGLVGGRTLYEGVRRLSPGHLLAWDPSSAPREILQYRVQFSDRYFDRSFDEHVEIMHEAMGKMIYRQSAGTGSLSQLFSGGLDSRLLGGYLRENDLRPTAVTFGRASDIEMACAKKAARALGFPQVTAEEKLEDFEKNAELEARWRGLSGGFSCLFDWQRPAHLSTDRVLAGYALETITGGSAIQGAQEPGNPKKISFKDYFNRINSWGIPIDTLEKLLRKDVFGDAVCELKESIRVHYEAVSEREFQKPMGYDLVHRQRFHTLAAGWIHSFGAWPILPGTDRRIIETAAGMPEETLKGRRLQRELLCRHFKDLAVLPLDTNSYYLKPLSPKHHRLFDSIRFKATQVFFTAMRPILGERLYYYRLMDFNGRGWKQVRRQAEASRDAAMKYFNKTEFDRTLPIPSADLQASDKIINNSGARILTGFMLWDRIMSEKT